MYKTICCVHVLYIYYIWTPIIRETYVFRNFERGTGYMARYPTVYGMTDRIGFVGRKTDGYRGFLTRAAAAAVTCPSTRRDKKTLYI